MPPPISRARHLIRGRAHSALVHHLVQPPVGAPDQPPVNPYDYSTDPGYQRAQGIAARDVGDAEAQALAARKQLAIDQGDPSLAPDAQTAAAASANPFSLMAKLAQRRRVEPLALTEADNSRNLFYSGAGATHQSDLVRSLMEAQTGIEAGGRAGMSQIDARLLSARQGASDLTSQAEIDAAARLQARLGDLPVGQPPPVGAVQARRAQSQVGGMAHRLLRPPPRPHAPRPPVHPHYQP